MARYHGNQGLFTFGTVGWDARLKGFTAESTVAEIDDSKQGDTHTNTKGGLIGWTVKATLFLDDNVAPPEAGAEAALSVRYKTGGTPGTIEGNFILIDSSLPYHLNNDVMIDVTMKNQGTVTVTAPIV